MSRMNEGPLSALSDPRMLRSILDALPSHIAVLDERGVVLEVNERWRRFGAENEGVESAIGPGVNYLEVCERSASTDEASAGDVASGIRDVIGGRVEHYHKTYPCHSPDEPRWFQVRVIRCAEDPVRVVVAHETITEAHELELLRRRHQSELAHMMRVGTINELATGLAHELNQPLASIRNFAAGSLRRLDRADSDRAGLRDALQTIVDEAQRAGEILRRVRAYVRVGPPAHVRVSVAEVMHDAVALIQSEADASGITLSCEDASEGVRVSGDPVQLQQVLVNLIRNAIEAIQSADDLQDQRVSVRSSVDVPGSARVDVVDTGPGVPRDRIPAIFDPFYSTKTQTNEHSTSGLGLGLSLCRSIIETHGGALRCDINPLGGMTFTVVLPLDKEGAPHD